MISMIATILCKQVVLTKLSLAGTVMVDIHIAVVAAVIGCGMLILMDCMCSGSDRMWISVDSMGSLMGLFHLHMFLENIYK
jgi:hypothetical protein